MAGGVENTPAEVPEATLRTLLDEYGLGSGCGVFRTGRGPDLILLSWPLDARSGSLSTLAFLL